MNSYYLFLSLSCFLLLNSVLSDGNPCPLYVNDTAMRSCGTSLCFAGQFKDYAVLQRSPQISALYGATGIPALPFVSIFLTLSGTLDSGEIYSKTFSTSSLYDGTWKVLLDPMDTFGDFTATVTCSKCIGQNSISIFHLTFGDVWIGSGQSNMGNGSPIRNNFWRNESYEGIFNNSYSTISIWESGDSGVVPIPREELGNWVVSGDNYNGWLRLDASIIKLGDIDNFAATPVFFAMRLQNLMREMGERPPPIGIMVNAVGGTDLAAWAPYSAVLNAGCVNATCMCSDNWTQECPWQDPIENRTQCWCNGMQFARQIQPMINMTIKGMIFWQGENDCMFDAGNSAFNTGYACTLKAMVQSYRELWSVIPGTTPSDFPFGSVLISDGSEFGEPENLANIILSQTLNHGSLPNDDLPNSFLTLPEPDPYMDLQNPDLCSHMQCCVETFIPLGSTCIGDHRGLWTNSTPNQSSLHPRTKGISSDRLAQAAYASVYQPNTTSVLSTGPVFTGCEIIGSTLIITFDSSRLKGESVIVSKPEGSDPISLELENTALYILTNPSGLPQSALEGHNFKSDNVQYHGPYSKGIYQGNIVLGNEFGVSPWVAVMPQVGPLSNQISVDITLLSGAIPTAIRYNLGSGGNGDYLNRTNGGQAGRFCCGPFVDTSLEPCYIGSCPIKASGRLNLPAVPFLAQIENGKCKCIPPAIC